MRAAAAQFVESVTALHAIIDGDSLVKFENRSRLRAISPVFSLTLPADNIFGAPPGTYAPAVADGWYVMLAPLSPGRHTLRFGGATPSFSVNVTYHLRVRGERESD